MFDAGRLLAFAWAFVHVLRARAWPGVAALALAAYAFGLGVTSGLTVRAEGPMPPILAVLLALIGPTSLPRGALPSVPLAALVLRAPAVADLALGGALLFVARRINARVDQLPQFSEATRQLSRAGLAIVLVAVLEGVAAAIRLLPEFLDWGTGPIG